MNSVIPWLIIAICILVVLGIIIKKFPALALLDANNMPEEKEAKFKDRIMKQKVERDVALFSGAISRFFLATSRYLNNLLQSSQAQLRKIKINYKSTVKMPQIEKQRMIQDLLVISEDLIDNEKFNEAEEKLLEVISFDQKNLVAFFKLAFLYSETKKVSEARQTYEYALKLARQAQKKEKSYDTLAIQEIYFSLAELEMDSGDIEAALENIREALEYEPNSPRYLDLILDLSIMKKDKELALISLEKLAFINPDNQKLREWQEKINNI